MLLRMGFGRSIASPGGAPMASVFLSYDRDDSDRARHFARALEQAGHEVWWDLHVRGGAQFSKVIEEALKAAEVVVVLWSANAIESAWVRDEAAAGRDAGRLVPVTIDGTPPPLGFRQFQTADLSRWKGRGSPPPLRTLLADVDAIAASTGAGEADGKRHAAPPSRPTLRAGRHRMLLPMLAVVALLLAAAAAYRLLASKEENPAVTVVAADPSTLSQNIAHNVLVNLGSAGISGTAFRLIDTAERGSADLRVSVSGMQEGGKVQATVALVSSAEKSVLWSKQIETTAGQRAGLEQSLAYSAMGALACASDALGPRSPHLRTDDLRAYLNACVDLDAGGDPQPLSAVFRKVTQVAPGFAAGWANLLRAEGDLLSDGIESAEPTDGLPSTIRRDIESARKADPDLPAVSIAELGLQAPTSFAASISLIDAAKRSHPDDARVLSERSDALARVGQMYASVDEAGRAAELKPYSPELRAKYIAALAANGAIEKARAELAESKRLWPDAPYIVQTDRFINLRFGDFEKTWRSSGGVTDGGILGYFKILREPTDANIDAWINLAKTHQMLRPHRLFILQALGPLNRVDQLYDFLEQWPIDEDLPGITYILFRPWMKDVWRDPRFMRLAQRLKLLDYWRTSGNWPDFCTEPDMSYDCKKEAARLTA